MATDNRMGTPLCRKKSIGFTLIELMIVVAVVAILAAIAYPSYQEQVRKSHRAQAKADLVEYAQQAERWYTINNTYVGFNTASGAPPARSPREAASVQRYDLAYTVAANTFTITATPTTGGTQVNDRCGTLSINQASRKTNSAGTFSDCW